MGEEINSTTLLLMAHICAALDSGPEWLQWMQAPGTLRAAGAAGVHSWGLMGQLYVRYPSLNREGGDQWIVGTHYAC